MIRSDHAQGLLSVLRMLIVIVIVLNLKTVESADKICH